MIGVHFRRRESPRGYVSSIFRISILLVAWVFIAVMSGIKHDVEVREMMIVSMPKETILKKITVPNDVVTVEMMGPINKLYTVKQLVKDSPAVEVRAEWRDSTLKKIFVRSTLWKVYLSSNVTDYIRVKKILEISPLDKPYGYPENEHISVEEWGRAVSVVSVESKSPSPVGLRMKLDNSPEGSGLLYTLILIIILYAMTISEYIDRRFGCVLISLAAIALMSCLGHKPAFDTIAGWLDFGTLMVVLGSMIVVALMWETGFFDYITLVAYRSSKGHPWLLIYLLCMISAFLSAIMDNCTVVLLLAPAAIRLCEAAFLNAQIVLIIIAIYSNIGGSMTPVGGPANILIVNRMAREHAVNFSFFTANMLPVAVICMITIYCLIYFCVGERLYEIDENQIARRSAMKEPTQEIIDRMKELSRKKTWLKPVPDYYNILATVEANQSAMNLVLLLHIGIAFLFIFAGFILRSMPSYIPNASFGWISMLAAFLLLILANKPSISSLLARIEWGIMIYISCLFIITEVIFELGFITFLGELIVHAVQEAPLSHQTIDSMLIILWVSALTAAFLDDTAVASVFLQICIEIEHSDHTNVPMMSLVWALVLGANYGGIGTMLGSITNELMEMIAKEHGYRISFMYFSRIAFPLMIVALLLCTVYLLAAQAIIGLKPVGI